MDGEKVIAKLNRLLEKYESNKRAYVIVVSAIGAVESIYKAAEECRIGDVLNRVAALSRYREYCAEYRLPGEVCIEIATALWITKTDIPEILQNKCGCTLRKY